MLIRWSEHDQAFIAMLPEFDNALTHGTTYEEAARVGRQLIESFIMWYQQDGKPLPSPRFFGTEDDQDSRSEFFLAAASARSADDF